MEIAKGLRKKITEQLEEKRDVLFQRHRSELQLLAITYTWENGKVRTKKLATFDPKKQMDLILSVNREFNQITGLYQCLNDMWYDGLIKETANHLLEGNQ